MQQVTKLQQPIYIFCINGHGNSGAIAALLLGMTYCLKGTATIDYVQQQWEKYSAPYIKDQKVLKLGSPQGDNKYIVENF